MKRVWSLIAVLSLILSGCGGATESASSVVSTAKEEEMAIKETNEDEIDKENMDPFVKEHINYYNGSNYKADIVAGFPKGIQDVIDSRIIEDTSFDGEFAWTVVTDFFAWDIDGIEEQLTFHAEDQYAFLFGQLLYQNQGKILQNRFSADYVDSTIGVTNAVLNTLDSLNELDSAIRAIPDTTQIQLDSLLNSLGSLNPNTFEYNICIESIGDIIDSIAEDGSFQKVVEKTTEDILNSTVKDAVFIAKVATAIIESETDNYAEFIRQLSLVDAYVNTSDYFMEVLRGIVIMASSEQISHDKPVLDPDKWLSDSALEYYENIKRYQTDKALALLEDSLNLSISQAEDMYSVVYVEMNKKAVDSIISLIPGIGGFIVAVKDLNEMIKSISDVFGNGDEMLYANHMVFNCKRLLSALYSVVDAYGIKLNDSNATSESLYNDALCFDLAVNMYKQVALIGCDYAKQYLSDENLFTNEIKQISNIRCHNPNLDQINWENVPNNIEAIEPYLGSYISGTYGMDISLNENKLCISRYQIYENDGIHVIGEKHTIFNEEYSLFVVDNNKVFISDENGNSFIYRFEDEKLYTEESVFYRNCFNDLNGIWIADSLSSNRSYYLEINNNSIYYLVENGSLENGYIPRTGDSPYTAGGGVYTFEDVTAQNTCSIKLKDVMLADLWPAEYLDEMWYIDFSSSEELIISKSDGNPILGAEETLVFEKGIKDSSGSHLATAEVKASSDGNYYSDCSLQLSKTGNEITMILSDGQTLVCQESSETKYTYSHDIFANEKQYDVSTDYEFNGHMDGGLYYGHSIEHLTFDQFNDNKNNCARIFILIEDGILVSIEGSTGGE